MSRPRRHPIDEVHARFIWHPGPEPLHLRDPEQLIGMAFWFVPDLPVERDLFVLLDEDDRVVSMLCDPSPTLKANLTRASAAGPRRAVHQGRRVRPLRRGRHAAAERERTRGTSCTAP